MPVIGHRYEMIRELEGRFLIDIYIDKELGRVLLFGDKDKIDGAYERLVENIRVLLFFIL